MQQAAADPESAPLDWPARARRLGFRFGALYFALYFFPFPLAALFRSPEQLDWYATPAARLWDPIVNATGHLLGAHTPLSVAPPHNSSDGLASYVQLVSFALVAAVSATLWSILDRERPRERGDDFLRVWLRYVLAAMLLAYGFAKVFPQQMPLPEPSTLLTTYGRSHPMTLLWTFMGASPAYEVMAGLAEVGGAVLLFARRTAPLGALVVAAVMSNVVALNICYDVYVKQLAIHLLLLALFLFLPSLPRFFRAMALGCAVPATKLDEPIGSSRPRGRLALKVGAVGCIVYAQAAPSARHYFEDADGAPLPDLYGIYDVEEMRRNDEVVPPLLTDATYWRHVYIGRRRSGVELVDGGRVAFALARDRETSAGATWSFAGKDAKLSVSRAENQRLLFEGTIAGEQVRVRVRPTDDENLRLVRTRIHWVNSGLLW